MAAVAVENILHNGRIIRKGEELADLAKEQVEALIESGVAEVKKASGKAAASDD